MRGIIFSTSRKIRSGEVSAYTCVVFIWLCPSIFDTLSIDTPSESVICDAKVCLAMWKVSVFWIPQRRAIFLRCMFTVSQPGMGSRYPLGGSLRNALVWMPLYRSMMADASGNSGMWQTLPVFTLGLRIQSISDSWMICSAVRWYTSV